MGQRLVTSIIKDGKRIATVYQHWSAYSCTAMWELMNMADFVDGKPSLTHTQMGVCEVGPFTDPDPVIRLIKGLAESGGGLSGEDFELDEAKKKWPGVKIPICENRNAGIVNITEKGMSDSDNWAEGTATIDIDSRTVSNDCFYWYRTLEDLRDEYDIPKKEKIKLYDPPCDLHEVPFRQIEDALMWLNDIDKEELPVIETDDGYITMIR